MILPKSLQLPSKVLSGEGAMAGLPALAAEFGPRGIVVHGSALEKNGAPRIALEQALAAAGAEASFHRHAGGR